MEGGGGWYAKRIDVIQLDRNKMNKTNKTLLDMKRKSADKANELDKNKREDKETKLKRQIGKGHQVHHFETQPVLL